MVAIRNYHYSDRPRIREICADTAFFGDPVEAFFDDRALFTDAFLTYYTDYEPENIWVAEADGRIVGYLTGCFDTQRKRRINRQRVLPRLIWNFVRFRYRLGPKTVQFVKNVSVAHKSPSIDLSPYPAHLHINLSSESRGKGAGSLLMERFMTQVLDHHIRGVHIQTTDRNLAAIRLYEKFGFEVIASSLSRLYDAMLSQSVYNLIFAKKCE